MEKTLGELFDEYSILFLTYRTTESEAIIPEINRYKEIISKKLDYLANNLELNIMVNYLLRANEEYLAGLAVFEDCKDEWLEYSEELAYAAIRVHGALKVKDTYKRKINEFMRADI